MIISSPEQVKNSWTAVNLNEHTRFAGCAGMENNLILQDEQYV